MCDAIRLPNGYYKLGRKILTWKRCQQLAWKRGFRFLHVIEAHSGSHVDVIDLIDLS